MEFAACATRNVLAVRLALMFRVVFENELLPAVTKSTAGALAVMLAVSRGFAYGMTKPASDALYTRVPRETRYKGKNFVETTVWRFGDLVVTSGVSVLGTAGIGVGGMALVGVVVSAVATGVARRAGRSPDLLPEVEDVPEKPADPRAM